MVLSQQWLREVGGLAPKLVLSEASEDFGFAGRFFSFFIGLLGRLIYRHLGKELHHFDFRDGDKNSDDPLYRFSFIIL